MRYYISLPIVTLLSLHMVVGRGFQHLSTKVPFEIRQIHNADYSSGGGTPPSSGASSDPDTSSPPAPSAQDNNKNARRSYENTSYAKDTSPGQVTERVGRVQGAKHLSPTNIKVQTSHRRMIRQPMKRKGDHENAQRLSLDGKPSTKIAMDQGKNVKDQKQAGSAIEAEGGRL